MKIPRTPAVLTGIALVTFVSLFALVALVTLFADCSGSLYAGVDFSYPPVAVLTDKRCFSVLTVGTVLPVCSVLAVFTVSAVSAIRTF